ncbi:hypothetical protein J4456_04090 [Candidatus Pacearchaeota archaeon]|nr:hypothetical protein [Candidatus Pacearchaeota archaeon]
MNLKRALGIGLLTYVLAFVIGIVIMFLFQVDSSDPFSIPPYILYINIGITIILAAFFTLWYLRGKKIKPSVKEGFLFGITLIIIGTVIDVILFSIGALLSDVPMSLLDYYSNPVFWISLLLFLATTTLVGWIAGRRQ